MTALALPFADAQDRLRDVGSLNGTYVNHERADEAMLRHGDELQVGRYRLSFVLGGDGREQ